MAFQYTERREVSVSRQEYDLLLKLYQKLTQERMAEVMLSAGEAIDAWRETSLALSRLHTFFAAVSVDFVSKCGKSVGRLN